MINIIKQEIPIDKLLKKKLEFICDFCNTTPTFINGSIRKIDKSNLAYVEPHKVIINNIMFLVFNYSNDVYIKNFFIYGRSSTNKPSCTTSPFFSKGDDDNWMM